MMPPTKPSQYIIWGIAILLAATAFTLDGTRGFNPADEGFVWHAAWRTTHGDVPLRDFLSYDPGRHYWQAAWMWLLGDGLVSMRLADTLIQVVGLACGLFALTRITKNLLWLGIIGSLLMLGMAPSFKLFEPAFAMMLVLAGVRLLESPTTSRYFQAGVLAGLAGFVGKNLGVYAVLALGIIMVFSALNTRRLKASNCGIFCGGVLAGYAPALLMMLVIPGFATALWDSALRIIQVGAGNNLGLPVPWPWRLDLAKLDLFHSVAAIGMGLAYVGMVLFLALVPVWLVSRRLWDKAGSALLLSSWAVALVFAHHAFGRAGASHLAQSFHPFLIGLLACGPMIRSATMRRLYYAVAGMLAALAVLGVIGIRPFFSQMLNHSSGWDAVPISGSQLSIRSPVAMDIAAFRQIHRHCIGSGNAFFVAPNWPAAYPLLGAKPPTWDTYFMFPETEDRQARLIGQLEAAQVNWILLDDVAIDGRQERRFSQTYPLVYKWIGHNFVEVQVPQQPRGYKLLARSGYFSGNGGKRCDGWALP